MNLKPLYREIPFDRIEHANQTFRLSPSAIELPDANSCTIADGCIINPPVLHESGNGNYVIITGHSRIHAAMRDPATDSCSCLILPADTPVHELLPLALREISLKRPPSPVEKAVFWDKAVKLLGRNRAKKEFSSLLEVSRQLSTERLEKLLILDQHILTALHNGSLDLKTALGMTEIEKADRLVLFSIIKKLRLSTSNQRKLTDQSRELAKRLDKSIAEIFAESEYRQIIDHPDANPPQKTAMLMKLMNRRCYPRLSEAEKGFQNLVAGLSLPKKVRIEHTPSFEKDSLTMTIEFDDQLELTEKWPAIREIISADPEK